MPVNKEQCCKAARIKWFLHQNIIKRQKNIATEVRTSVKLTPNFKPPPPTPPHTAQKHPLPPHP